MSVKKFEVKTYQEVLMCDDCNVEMRTTGVVLCSFPAQYVHRCPKCQEEETPKTSYPNIVMERI